MRVIMLIGLTTLLTACGGGGDDNSSVDGRASPLPVNCAVNRAPCR